MNQERPQFTEDSADSNARARDALVFMSNRLHDAERVLRAVRLLLQSADDDSAQVLLARIEIDAYFENTK